MKNAKVGFIVADVKCENAECENAVGKNAKGENAECENICGGAADSFGSKKKYRIAVIPGSFDPVTLGHMDVIRRAAEVFDEVRAVIFINSEKKYKFTAEQRLELLSASCRAEFGDGGDGVNLCGNAGGGIRARVCAELSDGLLADYVARLSGDGADANADGMCKVNAGGVCKANADANADGACKAEPDRGGKTSAVIVKGIRNSSDFEYEFWLASINRSVLPIGAETFFIPARPEFSYINSTVVREMLRYNKSVRHYIPAAAAELIEKWQADEN